MRRVRWLVVLAFLLIPGIAQAIQLHWSSGADTLTFTEATRAILVLRADSAEVTLPPEWQLQWVGDSTEVQVVALDSLEVCEGDTAQVYGVDGPATPEDSTAHRVTAHFCSGGSAEAEQATFVLDLPAWGRGKCKVVALDPADSTAVLELNEVTFNGGVEDDYAPVLLRASSTHETAELRVTAIGSGLNSASSLRISAPDRLWTVPLGIATRSDSCLTATACVPTALPAGLLEVGNAADAVSQAPLAADVIEPLDPATLPDTVLFRDPDPNMYPKDFAFYYNVVPTADPQHPWKGLFHLIYIRAGVVSRADTVMGHAWSEDLRSWRVDKRAFAPDTNNVAAWDHKHVWAPSIVQVGDLYHMFYAGVDASDNQRIGYVTTAHLDTTNTQWSTERRMVYSATAPGGRTPPRKVGTRLSSSSGTRGSWPTRTVQAATSSSTSARTRTTVQTGAWSSEPRATGPEPWRGGWILDPIGPPTTITPASRGLSPQL